MLPARRRLVFFSAAILAALTAILTVALPAGTASAAVTAAGNRVWAISSAAQDHARAGRGVSADQRLGEAASCPFYAPGACVAPEAGTAANTGDHIVLGLRAQGLEQTAAKVGGRTLLKDPAWQDTLRTAVNDSSTRFTVSLDGFSGSSVFSQVMGAAQRGAAGAGGYTDWEMAQLYQAGRLADTTFVRGGVTVPNPFVP